MRWFSNIDDAQIDRLLDGQPVDDSRLSGVSEFLGDLENACPVEPTSGFEAAHVAAMVATAQLLAENGESVETVAHSNRVRMGWNMKESPALRGLVAHKWAAIASVAIATVLAFGGAAYAGVLPPPIENVVAAVAHGAGITLPVTRGRLNAAAAHTRNTARTGHDNPSGVARPVFPGTGGSTHTPDANAAKQLATARSNMNSAKTASGKKRATKASAKSAKHAGVAKKPKVKKSPAALKAKKPSAAKSHSGKAKGAGD